MTHYPRVALTFISGEIDELERHGWNIWPVVMNLPSEEDLKAPGAKSRLQRSLYLKSSAVGLLSGFARAFVANPVRMLKLVGVAIGSAQWDLALIARRLAHLCYAASVARYCERNNICHLHAHFGQSPATIAWFASEIFNFRATASCSWSFTIHGFQDFVDEKIARLDLKAASAKFVICVSDFTKSQLCRVADPRTWDRFHVVRCGTDLDAFAFQPKPITRPSHLIAVGRLSPEKGHITLLTALKSMIESGQSVLLEIVGSGPFEPQIRDQVEMLGLGGHVLLSGELTPTQVRERLAIADIFVMPSYSEGLPVSVMEAMAMGVPVVTTWISGIPELAVDGRTALTVPPSNSERLADALGRVVADAALREILVTNARSAVECMHSTRDNVAALARILGAEREG
jgi:glycosyltransferase involved in cell wall biosynthesis